MKNVDGAVVCVCSGEGWWGRVVEGEGIFRATSADRAAASFIDFCSIRSELNRDFSYRSLSSLRDV